MVVVCFRLLLLISAHQEEKKCFYLFIKLLLLYVCSNIYLIDIFFLNARACVIHDEGVVDEIFGSLGDLR